MLSYTAAKTLYQDITDNTGSANQTFFDRMYPVEVRRVLGVRAWSFLEATDTITTTASTQSYDLPYNYKKLINLTVTVGTTQYNPKEATDWHFWNSLNEGTSYTSDTPEYFFISNRKLYLWPTPSSGSNTITVYYRKQVKGFSNADYSTGTVTLTNGDATVVGSGTTFTAAMVGRWIKGDTEDDWYQIGSFTDATNLELVKTYQGTTAAGLSYTIGDMSPIPEDFEGIPIYKMASMYWAKEKDNRWQIFDEMYKESLQGLIDMYGSRSDDVIVSSNSEFEIINPNLSITQ